MSNTYKQKATIFIATILAAFIGAFATLSMAAVPANAMLSQVACDGFQDALPGAGGCAEEGGEQINSTLETVVNVLSAIVAIISVIMIIIAGFKYVTSNGDSGSINSAKDTIIYAIVGLIIVAVAQFIVNFVLDNVINGDG